MTLHPDVTYIGIDIGTSSVKALLVDDHQRVCATATRELALSRPHAGWSEQDNPTEWRAAAMDCLPALVDGSQAAGRMRPGLSRDLWPTELVEIRNPADNPE